MLKILLTTLVAISVAAVSNAQQGSMLDLEKLTTKVPTTQSSLLTGEQIPTTDVVDPSQYVLGPGDVLSYQTTGLDFSEKLTVVTPENSIMVERYGLINVDGLTLTQARERIKQLVADRSSNIEVFVALKRPRLIYVSVQGNVPFPGTYAVPASMRVSSLLQLSSQPWLIRKDATVTDQVRGQSVYSAVSSVSMPRDAGVQLSAYAMRNIIVKRKNGIKHVDLALAKVPSNNYADPHLCEGDVITVPMDNGIQSTITVSGAVANPTTVAYKKGDKVSLLLAAAGGPTDQADLENVTLVQGQSRETITLHLTSNFAIQGSDLEVEAGSVLTVGSIATTGTTQRQGIVQVYGEVHKPGAVVITPGVTRISEILQRVGGVKANASLNLSYVVRPDEQPATRRELSDVGYQKYMYSDLKLEDTLRFQMDQHYRIPYVSCNLAAAIADSSSSQNITMMHGDVVVIVPTPDRIFVYGQVNQPGYVPFTPNKSIDWYVAKAGGFATGAAESRVRIIRGTTKVWVHDDDSVVVYPGDEVYAPRPPQVPAGVELQTWAMIAGILSSAAALAATIISLTR